MPLTQQQAKLVADFYKQPPLRRPELRVNPMMLYFRAHSKPRPKTPKKMISGKKGDH
jgi:hypothetical protein